MNKGTEAVRLELAQTFAQGNDKPADGVPTHTGLGAKREESARLAADVEAFLSSGREVEQIPVGVSAFSPEVYIPRRRKGARK